MKITVNTAVLAPIDKVWKFYTSAEHIVHWNAASIDWHTTRAEVDLQVGGKFSSRMEAKDGSMGFDFAGIYTNLVEPKLIEYQFGERTAKVELLETAHGVQVTIQFDPENMFPHEQQQQGWQAILDNFKRYVEEN